MFNLNNCKIIIVLRLNQELWAYAIVVVIQSISQAIYVYWRYIPADKTAIKPVQKTKESCFRLS